MRFESLLIIFNNFEAIIIVTIVIALFFKFYKF